ncbi:MAG: transporter substrate-binding domain-containing protein [Defluviitaleaceae bacterium]|nr:transporter substrate-binding domain-containing protein [Defluviitaleaceae bacterium]
MFMKNLAKMFILFLLPVILSATLSGCRNADKDVFESGMGHFESYRDIPGVTAGLISEIEALRERHDYFTYGMLLGTEAFPGEDGEIKGYAAHVCRWLTELFGIPFIPKIVAWEQLSHGLEDGIIDFTGTLMLTGERRQRYYMTDAIAQRTIMYFRLEGSLPLTEIAETRLPRYALLQGAVSAENVLRYATEAFEPVYVHEYIEAYDLLMRGEIDALLAESSAEAIFDIFGNVESTDFFPLVFAPVSLSAYSPAFSPIITVVQLALDSGAIHHFNELYNKGHQEYLRQKLFTLLTDEEIAYIRNNPVIPFAAEFENYPVSFINNRNGGQWQGISHDVLRGIEALTGLTFEIVNEAGTDFPVLLQMVENGEAYLLSEIIRTSEREGHFIWPTNSLSTEWSVLISKTNYPNVNINRVFTHKVGLSEGHAHTEFFSQWFPTHHYTIMYANQQDALDALITGDIDLLIASNSFLLYLTNYLEFSDYKANLILDNSFESTFGVNKNQPVLLSVIDKAMALIDTTTISEQWRSKKYDYRLTLAQAETEARRPWLIGMSVLAVCVFIMLALLLIRKHGEGRRLDLLVKKRTAELEDEKGTLQTIFDSVPDLIFCKDLDLNFTRCNESLLKYFNLTKENLIGYNDFTGLGIPEKTAREFRELDMKVIKENRPTKIEEYIPTHDGTEHLFETSKVPLVVNGKTVGIMGIAHDITERKNMEETALNANRAKSVFLANMSHEIRTPMNAILGIAEMQLQREFIDTETRVAVEMIYTSGDMLLGIINDILDLSKIEAGKLELTSDKYEIASLVSDTVQLNMMRIGSKRITFELHIDENVPAQLLGDELRVKQIMNNLLSNAFKYTLEGVVKLTIAAQESTEKDGDIILIVSISDTGQGMTEAQIKMIGDEYTRFNQEANRSTEGTGLGMSITKNLICLMGGEIAVESEKGKGSVFTVRLPQRRVGSNLLGKEVADNLRQFRTSSAAQMKRVQITRDPMPYGEVLVVDDVVPNIYVAKGLLAPYELKIDTADSGYEAIEKIKKGKIYDIIFMDHMMPEMDGIEAVKHIRDLGYDHPVVALTANAVAGQANLFLLNGFDDYLSKPIDLRQMNRLLNKMIRDKQPTKIIEAARRAAALRKAIMTSDDDTHVKALLFDKKIDGLDISDGIGNMGGDEKAYIQILRSYAINVRSQLPVIESVDETTLAKYKIIVHGIKGTSYYIGALQIGDMAKNLEQASENVDIAYVRENNPIFLEAARVFIDGLDVLFSDIDAENPKPIKNAPDKETLAKLLDACKSFNMDDLDAAIEEIEQYQYESDDGFMDWLRETLSSMDLRQIAAKLTDMGIKS